MVGHFKEGLDCPLLHDIFRAQAKQSAGETAVIDGGSGRKMTYQDLDALSDRLASWLQARGAGPDKIVGIYMSKQLEYVVSYVAILKAGAAYLPIDVAYPSDLVKMVVEDAKPVAILTSSEFEGECKKHTVPFLAMTGDWESTLPSSLPHRAEMTADNLAYVVYSSGTTGKPKGISCPHRGAVLSYSWRFLEYPYKSGSGEEGRTREGCNVFFVWEMLRPLLEGQVLVVIPDSIIYDVDKLPEFIQSFKIDRMLFTPSLLEAVLEGNSAASFPTLDLIILCGEVVTMQLREKVRKRIPQARIHNLYSVSECHDVAGCDLTEDKSLDLTRKFCPVGRLLPHVQAVICDEDGSELPPGLHGEIFVAGPTLAREYVGRKELTEARFPERGGRRMYKTGDVGYLVQGDLEISGRCDSMVKVRGYSIELRAVQMALLELSHLVGDCVVLASGDAADTDKTLIAYIVPSASLGDEREERRMRELKKEIRTLLKQRLPFYMIPSFFEFLSAIPVNQASGKLDKSKLPSLAQVKGKGVVDNLPASEDERKVASIFQRILNLPSAEIDSGEGFFELGGHSLLTIPLINELKKEFGVDVSLDDLFAHPSIVQMSSILQARRENGGGRGRALSLETPLPLDLAKEVDIHYAPRDISMQIRAFWRHIEMEKLFRTSRVLVTGATGFLGAHVLRSLLEKTNCYVYCLVRPKENNKQGGEKGEEKGLTPKEACRKRVVETLKSYDLYGGIEISLEERLTVLVGDASLEKMGLDPEDYGYLSQHIDGVIHSAAYVNLLYPYSALLSANVRGTANVVGFCEEGKIKALHYISSNSVFPSSPSTPFSELQDLSEEGGRLKSGYGQSKWVAEQIVLKAQGHGLPGAVYRLGNLGGGLGKGGRGGRWNLKDSNLMLLKSFGEAGVPSIEGGVLEVTPVDFCADFVVSCMEDIRHSNRKVFHLIQPKKLTFSDVQEAAKMGGLGWEGVGLEEWKGGGGDESRLREICFGLNQYQNSNVESWLRMKGGEEEKRGVISLPSSYPSYSLLKFSEILKTLVDLKILKKKSKKFGKLQGKIFLVTGASSGIGESVARGIVGEGGRVVMVARRKDRLLKMAEELGGEEVAFPFSADVTLEEEMEKAVKEGEAHFQDFFFGIVNCAGVMHYQEVLNFDTKSFIQQIDVNCKGVVIATSSVLKSIKKGSESSPGRGGHIVNISSDAGRKVFPGLTVYSASKFFVQAWGEGLRQELVGLGVKVTHLLPGDVKTELLTHNRDEEALKKFGPDNTDYMLLPSDIADSILFALTFPGRGGVNEILVEPKDYPL